MGQGLKVTFLVMIFVKEVLISGGDDGYIYVWDKEKIIQRHYVHTKLILCMDSEKGTDIFATGGKDGKVILLRLGRFNKEFFDVVKVKEFNIFPEGTPETLRTNY